MIYDLSEQGSNEPLAQVEGSTWEDASKLSRYVDAGLVATIIEDEVLTNEQ